MARRQRRRHGSSEWRSTPPTVVPPHPPPPHSLQRSIPTTAPASPSFPNAPPQDPRNAACTHYQSAPHPTRQTPLQTSTPPPPPSPSAAAWMSRFATAQTRRVRVAATSSQASVSKRPHTGYGDIPTTITGSGAPIANNAEQIDDRCHRNQRPTAAVGGRGEAPTAGSHRPQQRHLAAIRGRGAAPPAGRRHRPQRNTATVWGKRKAPPARRHRT